MTTTNDPIADMLTRIRNANLRKHDTVDIPVSKMKVAIADILVDEGYIAKYEYVGEGVEKAMRVYLKYGKDKNEKIIKVLRESPNRVSAFTPEQRSFRRSWAVLASPSSLQTRALSQTRKHASLKSVAKFLHLYGK